MDKIIDSRLTIAAQDEHGVWQSKTVQQDIITNHLQEYHDSWARACQNPQVTPVPPDNFVPSVIGLYDDATPATPLTTKRDRGILRGWAALSYDYHDNNQGLQGSRVAPQFKTEFLDNGYVKHTVVAEFGTAHANGNINKIRLYGNRTPQYSKGNAHSRMDYKVMTHWKPYCFNNLNNALLNGTASVTLGWGGEYKVDYDYDHAQYWLHAKTSRINADYAFFSASENIDGHSVFEIRKLASPHFSHQRPEPHGLVGSFILPKSNWDCYNHTAFTLTENGDVYGVIYTNIDNVKKMSMYQWMRANNYAQVELGEVDFVMDEVGFGWNYGQLSLVLHNNEFHFVYRNRARFDTTDRNFAAMLVFDKETLVRKKYSIVQSHGWEMHGSYRPTITDMFVLPDGNYAVAAQLFNYHSEWMHAYPYVIHNPDYHMDFETTTEHHMTHIQCGRSSTGSGNSNPYYSLTWFMGYIADDFYYSQCADRTRINGWEWGLPVSYDPSRQAFAAINLYHQVGWGPLNYCGQEMILAESVIPDFVKTEEQAIRVVFEYIVNTSYTTEPPAA